jgi:hypothetical protein
MMSITKGLEQTGGECIIGDDEFCSGVGSLSSVE